MHEAVKYLIKKVGIFIVLKVSLMYGMRMLFRMAAEQKAKELGYDSLEEALQAQVNAQRTKMAN